MLREPTHPGILLDGFFVLRHWTSGCDPSVLNPVVLDALRDEPVCSGVNWIRGDLCASAKRVTQEIVGEISAANVMSY